MITAITYGDAHFDASGKFNLWTAKRIGGADRVIGYGPRDIDAAFYRAHQAILDCERGGGYWLWKPYVIDKTLQTLRDGDYLMYADAGTFYVRGIRFLIRQMEEDGTDIFLSTSLLPMRHWCKRDAYVLMGCDTPEARELFQLEGGYMLLRKSENSVDFIRDWLDACCDGRILTDDPNVCGLPDDEGFRENRHDQVPLTLLAYKRGIRTYRGISDHSEWAGFSRFKDGEFYGYARAELRALADRIRQTELYRRSHYPRIIVNTNIRDRSGIGFYLRIAKDYAAALCRDVRVRLQAKRRP